MDHHHQVRIIDRRDRDEVAHQLVRLVRDQRLVDGVRVRHHQQRVAVRRRLRDRIGADDRARAGAILDDECLLEMLGEMLRDLPRKMSAGPPGPNGTMILTGRDGIVLRIRDSRSDTRNATKTPSAMRMLSTAFSLLLPKIGGPLVPLVLQIADHPPCPDCFEQPGTENKSGTMCAVATPLRLPACLAQ